MTIHTLEPTRETLHGHFSRDMSPALTIDSGDTVRIRTLDANWFTEFTCALDNPPETMAEVGKLFEPINKPEDAGHALCGPIAVRGAKAGQALAIHFNRIVPGEWGWSLPWYGTEGSLPIIIWQLDAKTMTGRNQHGHTIALEPFCGVIGMPADVDGLQITTPPRINGGNLDCKALTAGTTLYLPVAVDGGLLSLGDGHAAQGDGESGGTAIECPLQLVDITVELINTPLLDVPYADTPAGWLVMGMDQDMQNAHDMALSNMQTFIANRYNVDRLTALSLMGTVVDMRITQTVNGVKGVHAILPHGALR